MALTATATPSVRQEIIQHLIQTTQAVGSVNQQNIFYSCHELKLQPQGILCIKLNAHNLIALP